jgi:hypothetical protein
VGRALTVRILPYCTDTAILYAYCRTALILLLLLYCTHTVRIPILYAYCHTVLMLYPYCTHTVLIMLLPYCTHTHAVLALYSYSRYVECETDFAWGGQGPQLIKGRVSTPTHERPIADAASVGGVGGIGNCDYVVSVLQVF